MDIITARITAEYANTNHCEELIYPMVLMNDTLPSLNSMSDLRVTL
jgi:hypothetical protein